MAQDKIVIYPIIIRSSNTTDKSQYQVYIPALNAHTHGSNIADAMNQAEDHIGAYSFDNKLPKSNYTLPQAKNGEIVTLVKVDISEYQRTHEHKSIQPSLTIPSCLNEAGIEAGLNFSNLLKESLKQHLK